MGIYSSLPRERFRPGLLDVNRGSGKSVSRHMREENSVDIQELANRSTIPFAYRMAYVINWYREPLLKQIESDFGFSRPEWTVLLCLSLGDTMISKDIARITGQPRNSISRAVERLVSKRLIRRSCHGDDRRKSYLDSTERGQALFQEMVVRFEARERQMLSALSAAEQVTLDRILNKLTANVPRWQDDCGH